MDSRINANQIRETLLSCLPQQWDGKTSILEMRALGSSNWAQSEWPGFYFELLSKNCLEQHFGKSETYKIDKRRNVDYSHAGKNWDFKHHSVSQKNQHWIISNDVELIRTCIKTQGHWGLILGIGACTKGLASRDCPFQVWVKNLRGGPSKYSKRKAAEGAPSRARKITASLEEICIIEFTSVKELDQAMSAGWANDNFQKGMKNSNNKPRNAKYKFKLNEIIERNVAI